MISFAGILRGVADWMDPPTFGEPKPYDTKLVAAAQRSAFEQPGAQDRRSEHAMKMLDPETLGYLLILVRDQPDVHIEPVAALRDEAWPAVGDVMARLCIEADRMKVGQ